MTIAVITCVPTRTPVITMCNVGMHRRSADDERARVAGITGRPVANRNALVASLVLRRHHAGLSFRTHAVAHRSICLLARNRRGALTVATAGRCMPAYRFRQIDQSVRCAHVAIGIDVAILEPAFLGSDRRLQNEQRVGRLRYITVLGKGATAVARMYGARRDHCEHGRR